MGSARTLCAGGLLVFVVSILAIINTVAFETDINASRVFTVKLTG